MCQTWTEIFIRQKNQKLTTCFFQRPSFSYNLLVLIYYYIVSIDYRMSTQVVRPVRSISYNDIKKRRLLRQSKSKGKLRCSQASTEVVQTEKKINPNIRKDIYQRERPNQVEQIRQIISRKTNNSDQVKDTIKKRNRANIVNFTQRVQRKKKSNGIPFHENDQNGLSYGNSRQIVKQLIEQSKSQRKLLKYRELRNKYKLSKSKSHSKSAKSLIEKSKMLAKRFLDIDLTPEKPINSPIKGVKNSHRVKRFESVKQTADSSNRHNYRYLVSAPRQQKEFFKGENNKRISVKLQDQVESSIQAYKQSSMFDSQQDRKFLEDICLKPHKSNHQTSRVKEDQKQERILDLLDAQPSELYKYFGKKQRQKKLANDLQKLNKKFPKGFFKI